MDGIMTGEQVWRARAQNAAGRGVEERMSTPRALREADRVAGERSARSPGLLRRVARWWIRGWTAFAASAGQPYLSLTGRLPAGEGEGGDAVEGEGPKEARVEVGRRA